MILECKSCQKKFLVPDSAITSSGRLVQCSSCGNKWTQFPIKKIVKKQKEISPINIIKSYPTKNVKKKNKVKKKTGPSIYSKEYLEKKHGIKIGQLDTKAITGKNYKKTSTSYFGFYSYIILFLVVTASFLGLLNLTKNIVISNFPFTEVYINYLFENLNYFGILIRDALNLY